VIANDPDNQSTQNEPQGKAASAYPNGQDPDDLLELTVPFQAGQGEAFPGDVGPSTPAPTLMTSPGTGATVHVNGQAASLSDGLPEGLPPGLSPDAPAQAHPEEVQEGNWFLLFLRELVETLVLALIIFFLIRTVVQNYRIEGHSMDPNFQDGEYLLVNKLAYRIGEYQRGDVVVFRYPNDPSRDFIKRIIGLPGETVEIRGGVIYIDGQPLQEPYDTVPINYERAPVLVEPGHLYVLGDNRPYSSDSHQWGLLPTELVIGKAWLGIWPPSAFGIVPHQEPTLGSEMAQGP